MAAATQGGLIDLPSMAAHQRPLVISVLAILMHVLARYAKVDRSSATSWAKAWDELIDPDALRVTAAHGVVAFLQPPTDKPTSQQSIEAADLLLPNVEHEVKRTWSTARAETAIFSLIGSLSRPNVKDHRSSTRTGLCAILPSADGTLGSEICSLVSTYDNLKLPAHRSIKAADHFVWLKPYRPAIDTSISFADLPRPFLDIGRAQRIIQADNNRFELWACPNNTIRVTGADPWLDDPHTPKVTDEIGTKRYKLAAKVFDHRFQHHVLFGVVDKRNTIERPRILDLIDYRCVRLCALGSDQGKTKGYRETLFVAARSEGLFHLDPPKPEDRPARLSASALATIDAGSKVLYSALAALYRDTDDLNDTERNRIRGAQFKYYDSIGHASVQLVFDLLNVPENAQEEQQRFDALVAAEVRQAFNVAATALTRPLNVARAEDRLETGIHFRLKGEGMAKEFSPPSLARQTFAILREWAGHATPNDRAQLRTMFLPEPPLSFWKMMAAVPQEQIDNEQCLSIWKIVLRAFGHVRHRKLSDFLLTQFPDARQQTAKLSFTPTAQHLFAGILMAADWMASGFAFTPGEIDQLAADVLRRTAWSDWHSGVPALNLLDGREPRPAQIGTLALPLDERLAVIEAPTGTGKTEAALIWASRLVEAGEADGLYFAVPTRSAASELHARIGRLMSAHYPALKGRIVRALPGMLDTDNSVPDYPGETWAVAAPKRTFAAPIAIGTIDQALLSILRSRHAWMRAAFLSRHLLVVDEVHASDPYMAALTRGLIERHLSVGGRALAMSATLGETALAILMNRERRSIDEAIAIPYPAIRRISSDDELPQAPGRTVDVAIEPFERAVSRACAAATEGQSVLWIRSTVFDAVADFQSFEAVGVNSLLHHSRYAVEDRTWLDQQLLSIFGVNGKRRSIIAVTTQTAEQSLDIDADLLVTDACPADVLLQRLGRLHRHRVGTRPTAVVIDPGRLDQYLLPKGKVVGRSGQGWPWVYDNLLSVRATLDWLYLGRNISIPDDCRSLVERATHADYLREMAASLGGNWTDLWRELFDDAAIKAQLAEASLIDWKRPYREALVNEFLPTRLGEGTVTVAVENLMSPFTGEEIEALPIPGRWLRGTVLPDEAVNVVDGRLRIGTQIFTYDRLGIRRLK
jgi:CRISPR-associated endonuclease/helicase Cas3